MVTTTWTVGASAWTNPLWANSWLSRCYLQFVYLNFIYLELVAQCPLLPSLFLTYFSFFFFLCQFYSDAFVLYKQFSCFPPGQWVTLRTTTACHLQEATESWCTETPRPASPPLPQAWWASPPWGHLEWHQVPLYATSLRPTGEYTWGSSAASSVTSWFLTQHVECYS